VLSFHVDERDQGACGPQADGRKLRKGNQGRVFGGDGDMFAERRRVVEMGDVAERWAVETEDVAVSLCLAHDFGRAGDVHVHVLVLVLVRVGGGGSGGAGAGAGSAIPPTAWARTQRWPH
jgi:hypothetical protein